MLHVQHAITQCTTHQQVLKVVPGGRKLCHSTEVAHVDPSQVHGLFQGLPIRGGH